MIDSMHSADVANAERFERVGVVGGCADRLPDP